MAWLVVNPDGRFKIFEFFPQRCKEPSTKLTSYLEKEYHPDSEKFECFWAYPYIPPHSLYLSFHKGIDINKEILSQKLQKLTWEDEPIEISC